MTLKLKPAFGGRDTILLHFNRVLPHEVKEKTDEILARKYVDHIATHKFGSVYAAKCFIDTIRELSETAVLEPSEKWVGPNRLYLNAWILISSDKQSSESLEDIIEHNYTSEEKKWRLPHPYDTYAEQIAFYGRGTHPQLNTRTREHNGQPPLTDEERKKINFQIGDTNVPPKKRIPAPEPKRASVSKKDRVKASRQEDPNVVTLASICSSLKVDPKEARQALRKSHTPKPDAGWQWPKKDQDKITAQVKKAVEALRSKKK